MNFVLREQRPLLYQEVVSALYQIIDTQNVKPGDQLPSERDLIAELGVSRNVLREAFHVLEQRGIITSRQGKGRFLRALPASQMESVAQKPMMKYLERYSLYEAYEVRQTLEVKAMELIVRNATDEDIEDIEALFEKISQQFVKTKSTLGEFELHREYAKKTGCLFMEQTLDIVLKAILDMMLTTSHDLLELHVIEREINQHREIIDALKARDTERAKTAMHDHMQATLDILE